MVFKTGDLGLGYYRDGSVKVSIAAALHDDWRPKPIQLNLNALIQVNEQNKSCAAAATLKKVRSMVSTTNVTEGYVPKVR